jgi:hypothetical protein
MTVVPATLNPVKADRFDVDLQKYLEVSLDRFKTCI